MPAPCEPWGDRREHCCCNRTPGAAALPHSSPACPHFLPHSHKILMLLFKVWALFQEDFQDCRQGSGDALTSVWSVSPGWSEIPGMPRAHQPVSSVWGCSIPSSKSQSAEFNILFITPRDKFIFVSISFTDKWQYHAGTQGPWKSQGEVKLFSLLVLFFNSFGSFVFHAEEIGAIKKILHLSYNAFLFCYALKLCFLKITMVFLL